MSVVLYHRRLVEYYKNSGTDTKPEIEWLLPQINEKNKKTRYYNVKAKQYSNFHKIYFPSHKISIKDTSWKIKFDEETDFDIGLFATKYWKR